MWNIISLEFIKNVRSSIKFNTISTFEEIHRTVSEKKKEIFISMNIKKFAKFRINRNLVKYRSFLLEQMDGTRKKYKLDLFV